MKHSFLEHFGSRNKKIGFFGLGVSNLALLSLLPKDTKIIIRSEKKIDRALLPSEFSNIELREGEMAFSSPEEEILYFSPSVRRDRAELLPFKRLGVVFSSDAELFFSNVKSPVFAVSGSDGKSTTTALVSLLLSEKFGNPAPVGNIGEAMTPALLGNHDAYAVELSSFMLSYLRTNASRAAVTNITPNHLDWHRSFEEYRDAKLSLLKTARERVICADDAILESFLVRNGAFAVTSSKVGYRELKRKYSAAVFYTRDEEYIYRDAEVILPISAVKIPYEHNLNNLLTALAMCDGYATRDHISRIAKSFCGLPHRAELFKSFRGVDFFDSSIDSTPQRTVSTLASLGRRCVIILGGKGKGLSYEPLAPMLTKYARAAFITGENREEISSSLGKFEGTVIPNFKEAVLAAARTAKEGDAVILSPASTSYDCFKNYEERGKKFKEIIAEFCSSQEQKLE